MCKLSVEENAIEKTVERIVAQEEQHIDSIAIPSISAKPIMDIDNQLLYVMGWFS